MSAEQPDLGSCVKQISTIRELAFIVFPRQNPTGPRYNRASKNSNWNRSAKHIYGGQSHRPKIQIIVNTSCDR